jgi:hypothetical protein
MSRRDEAVSAVVGILQELTGDERAACPECRIRGDHTWWCKIAPAVLPDGTRPYYWRE